ncbi:hypothetical protein [Klebsiella pneumoniae]|uniref:hypothetical protein n=1 Tax=Klebsiella pneumoniae TaxID=573 RepID=UPI00165E33F1|nr:hypothetical protein [Klebsiella pneumoniae]
MSGSAFAVTHHAFSSGAGRTSDGNGSHASTLKSPSYTKSVSWQHYQNGVKYSLRGEEHIIVGSEGFGGEKAPVPDFNLRNDKSLLKYMMGKWDSISTTKIN